MFYEYRWTNELICEFLNLFEWLIKKNQLFMNQTTWMAIINMAQIVRIYANPVFDLLKRVSQQSFVHNLDYTDPNF